MTPLVLLDVDGVLNAFAYVPGAPAAWPDWRSGTASAMGNRWPIRWAPEAVRRLLALHESGAAEVQWLTTWGHEANRELRQLLELPELVVAGAPEDEGRATPAAGVALAEVTPAAPDSLTGRWWKFDVVRELVARYPQRRMVWIDDDLALAPPGMGEWLAARAEAMLVAPDPAVGVSPDEVERIEAFVAATRSEG